MTRVLQTRTLPNVTEAMLSSKFWVEEFETAQSIPDTDTSNDLLQDTYQNYIRQHTQSMFDIVELWKSIRANHQLNISLPKPPFPPSPRPSLYGTDGSLLSEQFWQQMSSRVESALPIANGEDRENAQGERASAASAAVQPGFAVRRADVRRYPTRTPGFKGAADREFDRFQDTALHTFEPVLILFTTSDNAWYYIVSTTYPGWVQARDIAFATDNQFQQWGRFEQEGQPFIIPLSNTVYTQANPYDETVSQINLEYAAYIPLAKEKPQTESNPIHHGVDVQPVEPPLGNQSSAGSHRVLLPVRTDNGWLELREALVPAFSPIHFGFRPYTRASVVDSAFQLLSERYGWGDRLGCHDCSSFIMDSYRTIGIQMPRDAGPQEESLPNFVSIPAAADFAERAQLLQGLAPGDPLYMPGHTMMYLGYHDGHHYMIHDFAGYVESERTARVGDTPDTETQTQTETEAEAAQNSQTTSKTSQAGKASKPGKARAAGDGGLHDTGAASIPVNEIMVSTVDVLTSRSQTYLEEFTGAGSLF